MIFSHASTELKTHPKFSNSNSLNSQIQTHSMEGSGLSCVEDLNAGRDFWNMKCRIIRLWKQSFRWDMILLDERGRKIQAIVKDHLVPQFQNDLKEDAIILVRKFGVGAQKDKHRVVDLDHKVNFFRCTHVQSAATFSGHPYSFNFIPYTDILGDNLNGALTVDVIGRIAWAGDMEIFKSAGKESKCMNLDLQDSDGNVLRCTFWGSYAEQCSSFVASNQTTEMVIVVIQHGRVKEWAGVRSVQNDMFATRLFLNEELPEVNDLRRRLILKMGPSTSQTVLSSQTQYPLRDEFLFKTPKKNVDEIREVEKASSCVVVGTISMVEQEYGWFYKAHRKCHKKVYTKTEYLEQAKVIPDNFLDAPIDSLWCLKCDCIADSLIPKFKVQFRVQDNTGSVSFVMFDKDVSKVVALSASDIRDRQLKTGDMDNFPHELHGLQNKLLAFKIVVSEYNLEKNYHVYTVAKLCDDVEVIQELQGVDQVEELTPDEADPLAVKLDDSSQNAVDSKDATSVTGSSLAIDVDKDSATSPAVKRSIPFVDDVKDGDQGSAVRPAKKKLSA